MEEGHREEWALFPPIFGILETVVMLFFNPSLIYFSLRFLLPKRVNLITIFQFGLWHLVLGTGET